VAHEEEHIGIEDLTELLDCGVLDSKGTPALPERVQQHVAQCDRCQKLWLLFNESGIHLQSLKAVNPDTALRLVRIEVPPIHV
jgi:hypothetical protein